jgi:hypothetical protein
MPVPDLHLVSQKRIPQPRYNGEVKYLGSLPPELLAEITTYIVERTSNLKDVNVIIAPLEVTVQYNTNEQEY